MRSLGWQAKCIAEAGVSIVMLDSESKNLSGAVLSFFIFNRGTIFHFRLKLG